MKLRTACALAMCLAGAVANGAKANHLLLSEVGIDTVIENDATGSSEYVEIFNPTNSTISLDQYYLTDHVSYYNLVVSPDGMFNAGTTDYILRFPAGATIAPRGVVVVTRDAVSFLNEFFTDSLPAFTGQERSPQLFEIAESDAAVSNMVNLNSNTGLFSKTNSGEFVILFQWDGVSDLVKDVDMVAWGSPTGGNAFAPKTAMSVDGPDLDSDTSTYATDGGTVANLSVSTSLAYKVITRVSVTETGEPSSGGNGITGHDESMESCSVSWTGSATLAGYVSPGVSALPLATENEAPIVSSAGRDLHYPGSSDTIVISSTMQDNDDGISNAFVHLDTGTGFTTAAMTRVGATNTWTASVGPFADDTYVKYYVEAVDFSTSSALFPANAPAVFEVFLVDNNPVTGNDVIINEIMYDTPGSDAGSYEFVELYNRRSTPVSLAYFTFSDILNGNSYTFPEGAEIPGEGFLVITQEETVFNSFYTTAPVTNLYDWGTFQLNNNGDFPNVVHVNDVRWNGTSTALNVVPYTDLAPWPTTAGGTGYSIELVNPLLDNSVGTSWAASTILGGTPGVHNSVYSPSASAIDWQLFE